MNFIFYKEDTPIHRKHAVKPCFKLEQIAPVGSPCTAADYASKIDPAYSSRRRSQKKMAHRRGQLAPRTLMKTATRRATLTPRIMMRLLIVVLILITLNLVRVQ